jgi:hypothetical protein
MTSRKHNKSKPMSKHSFGHYGTEKEAKEVLDQLQIKHPNKKLEIVEEKRKGRLWKKYCVCEYVPAKAAVRKPSTYKKQ